MSVILMKHKFLLMLTLTFLLLSIICQIVTGVIYRRIIREADNMAATENKLLKQFKLKYANCYKLNGAVVNTSVFVDRFIQKIQFCGILLGRMPHISGQLMMLSVLMTGITICLCLAAGDTLFQIIPYYLISILGLYLYFSVSGIMDIQGQKTILKTELTDYLENHMMPHLAKEEAAEEEKDSEPESARVQEEKEILSSQGCQEELENLLKELLA